jgi:hypothetical protein
MTGATLHDERMREAGGVVLERVDRRKDGA